MLCFFDNSRVEGLAIPLVYARVFSAAADTAAGLYIAFSPGRHNDESIIWLSLCRQLRRRR